MVRRFLIFGFRCVVYTLLLKSGCKPAQKHPCDFVVNYEEFIQPSFPAWFKASKPLGTSIIWNCSNDNCHWEEKSCHWEEKIAIEKAPLASALVIVLPCCSLLVTLTSPKHMLVLVAIEPDFENVKEKCHNCQRKRHNCQRKVSQLWKKASHILPSSWQNSDYRHGHGHLAWETAAILAFQCSSPSSMSRKVLSIWSQRNLLAKNAIMISVVTKRALSAKVQI